MGEKVYLNIQYDSKKARNIRDNPRVSFVVDDCPTWQTFRGVLISGKAELILEGKSHQIGRDSLYKKYPKYKKDYSIEEGVWSKYILVITPTKISSWGPLDK
ncbi:MAG: pyridoxamine 5'-phosphate oxidase family protein [Candidatus Hodarchaeales archaeon]|jgi:nitroimidazol reductase NimA-like FMN-containing flavoprotein (pyridoxamine 5'-phosphate oxidase superfamily)